MAADLAHARHNEKACDYLYQSGNFNDWVVTTAFYAAIYYVHHELFPGQYTFGNDERVIHSSTFDDYFTNLRGSKKPHSVRIELVQEYMDEIYDDYKTLHDTCWTARYKNYQITDQEVHMCREALGNIRELCAPMEL